MWRQEGVSTYLTKGKQIYLEGRLQTRNYDDKDGRKIYVTEVVADDVILLSGRGEGGEVPQTSASSRGPQRVATPAAPAAAPAESPDAGGVTDDDVPF
jgi:single-strand DNA-binding protein